MNVKKHTRRESSRKITVRKRIQNCNGCWSSCILVTKLLVLFLFWVFGFYTCVGFRGQSGLTVYLTCCAFFAPFFGLFFFWSSKTEPRQAHRSCWSAGPKSLSSLKGRIYQFQKKKRTNIPNKQFIKAFKKFHLTIEFWILISNIYFSLIFLNYLLF